MTLLTAQDDQLLRNWNFYKDLPSYEKGFIQFAQIVYRTMAAHAKLPPNEAQCEPIMTVTLLADQFFANYMNACKGHMLGAVWPKFARAVVRYFLDKEWLYIRN
jgi:hypothetical protein